MLSHKGLTAMEARRRGMEQPGEAKPSGGMTRPHDQEEATHIQNQDGGDGMHHHEIHEHEDGSYSSMHTHPDGHKTAERHDDYASARDHMDEMHGEHADGEEDDSEPMSHVEPDGDKGEDLASMYSNGE